MKMIEKPRTYAYCRTSTRSQEEAESYKNQEEIIRAYCVGHQSEGLDPIGVSFYVDPSTSGKVPLLKRHAGGELLGRLQRGDHLVIAKLDRAFRRASDCILTLEQLSRQGVRLHICNLMGGAIDLSTPIGEFVMQLLAAVAQLERSFASERIKDALSRRKKRAIKYNCYPGYGFKWEKRVEKGKHIQVRVADEEERKIMKQIVLWHIGEQAYSFGEIREHLNFDLKVKTKTGTPWSLNRVRRLFLAELARQLHDNGVEVKKKEKEVAESKI